MNQAEIQFAEQHRARVTIELAISDGVRAVAEDVLREYASLLDPMVSAYLRTRVHAMHKPGPSPAVFMSVTRNGVRVRLECK